MTRCILPALLLAATALACVDGIAPPAKTRLVPVQGGTFLFGAGDDPCFALGVAEATCENPKNRPKTWPSLQVDVKPFAIEEHEVTNYQYEYCMAMGACPEPVSWSLPSTVLTAQYFENSAFRQYPMLNVSASMAAAYCTFVGRRLPYEWEWERVAGGPATTADEKKAHRFPIDDRATDIAQCADKPVKMNACDGDNKPAPVMGTPHDYVTEGGAKVWDLAGNAAEWVNGAFRVDITCQRPFTGCQDCFACVNASDPSTCADECLASCDDCKTSGDLCYRECAYIPVCIQYASGTVLDPMDALYRESGPERLARGGAYNDQKAQSCRARATDRLRSAVAESNTVYNIGFRCAVDIDPSCVDGADNNNDGRPDGADPLCQAGKPEA